MPTSAKLLASKQPLNSTGIPRPAKIPQESLARAHGHEQFGPRRFPAAERPAIMKRLAVHQRSPDFSGLASQDQRDHPVLSDTLRDRYGPANMALDEALLEWVAGRPETAFLRTYGWVEPTLTPGVFSEPERGPGRAPLARRSAGAPRHRRWSDLARSRVDLRHRRCPPIMLTLGRARRFTRRCTPPSRRVSAQGVQACRRAALPSAPRNEAERPPRRPFLCFTDRDPEDIVASGSRSWEVLSDDAPGQFCSTARCSSKRSDRTPELPGLGELAGVAQDARFWSGLVQEKIARALELPLVACDLPAAVSRQAFELEAKVYRARSWTERR